MTPDTTPSPAAHDSRQPSLALHIAGALAICLLVISIASLALWQEKLRYRERAVVATQNIANLLDHHVSNVFDKVDVLLLSEAEHFREQASTPRIDAAALNRHLAEQEMLIPELEGLRILDAKGVVRFGKQVPAAPPIDFSDRDFFIEARDNAKAGLIVYGPVFGRIAQKWIVVLARRLTYADGKFAGVIYANLATSHFETILSSPVLGPHGAATIRKQDLALVHRYPDNKNAVGSREVSRQLAEIIRQRPDGGDYIAKTALDGIERSNAYRKLEKYPFYVIVGLATDDYLGGWKENVLLVSGLAGLAVLITLLAAGLVYRYHRRLADDIEARIRIAAELEKAVAERTRLNAELEQRAHEAEVANRAKTVFLNTMSHELRTPMNGIMGMTTLALRRATDPKQVDQLRKAVQASEDLLAIINDILDYSMMESQNFTLDKVDFRMESLAESLIAQKGPAVQAKHLDFRMEIAPDILGMPLSGDVERIGHTLAHLVDNAVQFTSTGHVGVRILLEQDIGQEILARFEVSDTGCGISPEHQGRLFSAFEQIDGSTTREHGGIGLGLALSKRLVEAMGGSIGVTSSKGEGSTFWFTARLAKAAGGAEKNPSSPVNPVSPGTM